MPNDNDIAVLNIDEVAYEVANLSPEAQGLVEVYNRWSTKEDAARGELAILVAAKQTLGAQIVAKVREEVAAKAAAEAEVDAAVEPFNVTTDSDDAAIEPAAVAE